MIAVLAPACGRGADAQTAGGVASPPAPVTVPPAVNPAVTQESIGTTICVPGWTATVRPPAAYTSALKARQIAERHLPGTLADYEEDHLVPLELGGAPGQPLARALAERPG